MRCECGCGFAGEDPVVQFLIEEALATLLDGQETIAAAHELQAAQVASAAADAQAAAKAALEGF